VRRGHGTKGKHGAFGPFSAAVALDRTRTGVSVVCFDRHRNLLISLGFSRAPGSLSVKADTADGGLARKSLISLNIFCGTELGTEEGSIHVDTFANGGISCYS
jgi:hypothetical protein